MDESFSDFQKKKNFKTGPKNTQKAKAKTIKRKPLKKSKTQKDIRVFGKGKENELVSYTKKFSEICKNSSLDVDSEQLHLAIALSKSLLQSGSSTDGHNSQEEKHLSSQERTAKIKLTLQEYGFKVPNTKINTNRRKRLKKQYKLLLLSEQEKKQIITDKYLKILETNFYKSGEQAIPCNYKQSELFYKATNIPFENIKNNEAFYVKDLGLQISHNISLLRDWAQIPGRPLSPVMEVNHFKFSDINLKQEELDFMLTGKIENIKDIIKNKNTEHIKLSETIMGTENISFCIDDDVEVVNVIKPPNSSSSSNFKDISDMSRLSTPQSMISLERNISPDIFDDDITILEYTTSAKTTDATYNKKGSETCFMDLTECVTTTHIDSLKSKVNIHNENNISKRKSNDCMDITECVTSSKQMSIENIDLTKQFVPFSKSKHKKNCNNKTTSNKDGIETMDLTQSSNFDVETEIVEHKEIENESSDDTIIINDNIDKSDLILRDKSIASDNNTIKDKSESICNVFLNNNTVVSVTESLETVPIETNDAIPTEENICSPIYTYTDHVFDHSYIYDYDHFDDNQKIGISNSSSDESTIVNMSTQDCSTKSIIICTEKSNLHKKSSSSDINETSVNHEKIIMENCKLSTNDENDVAGSCKEIHLQISKCDTENNDISSIAKENNTEEIDTGDILLNIANKNTDEANHVSPLEDYNDYVFEHSCIYHYDDGNSPNVRHNDDNGNEIDLTQTSDVESTEIEIKNSLGKIDNISVDYDDVIFVENINDNISKSSSLVQDKDTSNCSKNSEVFEVSDKEFNYSLHQSRLDNYDADGFDDIENVAKKSRTLNRSMSENDLNIRDNRKKSKSESSSHNTTPVKAVSQDIKSAVIQTPNNDYIIKTRDVTPMADYSSMSSPERSEELKRYGLKPFKRKRAIQLLTYIYNQTHPVVESYEEISSSPAKRLKYDKPKQKSPKKSPKKTLIAKSPIKSCNLGNIEEMNSVLYIQTKDMPDIKEIYCDPEDWVFQTREKSKVHSCRVPLHIVFHNYVSCRSYLRESILRYEPVNIDVIHKELVSIGYRYNPKDLLKFMDKKCITVKTSDNNARNRR